MRKSTLLSSFLDSVNTAAVAVAVMAAVLFVMSFETLIDWKSITIATESVLVTFGIEKISVMWIILGGSLLGYIFSLI